VRGESERRRLEQEVLDLSNRRDALSADFDLLTSYERDYRERLVGSLEKDLEMLRSRSEIAPGPRPELSEVELPVASERVMPRDDPGPPTREIDMRSIVDDAPPPPAPSPQGPIVVGAGAGQGSMPANGVQAPGASMTSNASASSNGLSATAGEGRGPNSNGAYAGGVATEERTVDVAQDEREEMAEQQDAPAAIDLLAAENAHDEVLDDEAFFATLREAVSDDGMPGPREDDQSSLFDQDEDAASFKDVFRRRR
jgi:hypothetical protein